MRLWRLEIRIKGLAAETIDCEIFEFRDYGVWIKGGWGARITGGLGAGSREKLFEQRVFPWTSIVSATLIGGVDR